MSYEGRHRMAEEAKEPMAQPTPLRSPRPRKSVSSAPLGQYSARAPRVPMSGPREGDTVTWAGYNVPGVIVSRTEPGLRGKPLPPKPEPHYVLVWFVGAGRVAYVDPADLTVVTEEMGD